MSVFAVFLEENEWEENGVGGKWSGREMEWEENGLGGKWTGREMDWAGMSIGTFGRSFALVLWVVATFDAPEPYI